MRLLVDLQGAQSTGSRNRGIGRYTTSLVKAMVATRGTHDVHILLNGAFQSSIDPIKSEFGELVPAENIHVWLPPTPANSMDPKNHFRRRAAEAIREAVIDRLAPDAILIASLFEGAGDDAVTSIAELHHRIPTAVILYDLIPLINQTMYLVDHNIRRFYFQKIDHVRRADLLLTISGSTASECINYLDFPANMVVNILGACDSHFQAKEVTAVQRAKLAERYDLTKPFVMYTGGIDHRKNIEGLIRAYAALPQTIKSQHQLAIVCSVQPSEKERLTKIAKHFGLNQNDFVMTGFVPEDDLVELYNCCKAFVFPSWHEGFGLPALEAMACGRAVIAGNTSSLPEVVGRDDALFDPRDDESITALLNRLLTDEAFRTELEQHGLARARNFSWERSARTAWGALEKLRPRESPVSQLPVRRPRLAFVSCLPAVKSGIADYAAELLPELARFYQIDAIVEQEEPLLDAWIAANCEIRDVPWFRAHAQEYDRVLYHFGNSQFHAHMFDLLNEIPGVVVLHDFFLSGIVAHMDWTGQTSGGLSRSLFHSHGWPALLDRKETNEPSAVVWRYPCNLEVIQAALAVIVHSENARRMAEEWYGEGAAKDWTSIPLVRAPTQALERSRARIALGIPQDEFVACSFGALGPSKLNDRLLSAWLAAPMAKEANCRLVFVGQNDAGPFGADMADKIGTTSHVTITGWADMETYRKWLAAADVAIQLRGLSRGEASAAVLDCMGVGLPTVINANGSMREFPGDVVFKLPDAFADEALTEALTRFWREPDVRRALGARAQEYIRQEHDPRRCADQYFAAIENAYLKAQCGATGVIDALAPCKPDEVRTLAYAIARNLSPFPRRRTLFLDISEIVQTDARSGIQRVVRSILMEFLRCPPEGWHVEPVRATLGEPGYRTARQFACGFLGLPVDWLSDEPVEPVAGDRFLILDLVLQVLPDQKAVLRQWRAMGVQIQILIYDCLPLLMPNYFESGVSEAFRLWLETASEMDGIIAISRTVADEAVEWLDRVGNAGRRLPLPVSYFHLGADTENSAPSRGMPPEADAILASMDKNRTFLMVGTLEPRKGHALVLAAMERLWADGEAVQLIIVGTQGWAVESLAERLRAHPERARKLHWLSGVSDEFLDALYRKAKALVFASEGEGFGLPLIEAARHGGAIIARDITVFREIAEDHADYFAADSDSAELAGHLREWLQRHAEGRHPRSDGVRWITWRESALQLQEALDGRRVHRQWPLPANFSQSEAAPAPYGKKAAAV